MGIVSIGGLLCDIILNYILTVKIELCIFKLLMKDYET